MPKLTKEQIADIIGVKLSIAALLFLAAKDAIASKVPEQVVFWLVLLFADALAIWLEAKGYGAFSAKRK